MHCIDRHARVATVALMLGLCACSAPAPRTPTPTSASASASASATIVAPQPTQADAERRFQDALALMKARRHTDAQAAFLALTRDYPALSGPHTDLGILYARSGQRALALDSLGRAVAANPANAVALNWLGTLYREGGDAPRAEQHYRRALAARPDYAPAHLNLAILYDLTLHRPREALASYREYQRLGGEELVVSAWIRDLEARVQAAPGAVRTASASERLP